MGNDWPGEGQGMKMAYSDTAHRGCIHVYDRATASWGEPFLGSGMVGIGTLSPSAALDVAGNVIAEDPTPGTHLAIKAYAERDALGRDGVLADHGPGNHGRR